jgi:Mg2+ and Co2+ transporter CorA
MHGTPNLELTQPITRRLRQRDTGLRTSADPALLVQSLLDLVVDKALEVIDAYHVKIKKFEREILLKPKIATVRNLHILSGDLILHKRTLEPIRTVIYGLRRYDDDRVAALIDTTAEENKGVKVRGFMSPKSKIYLVRASFIAALVF